MTAAHERKHLNYSEPITKMLAGKPVEFWGQICYKGVKEVEAEEDDYWMQRMRRKMPQ